MVAHSLPSIRQTIASHSLKAKKQLSQNFIVNPSITDRIARLIPACDALIEIGPGPGTLTRSLLKHVKTPHVLAIEKDSQFISALKELHDVYPSTFSFIQSDVLKWDDQDSMAKLGLTPGDRKTVQIAGNLPFNISTALLLSWLERLNGQTGIFKGREMGWTLMFQKEVAERIVAKEGNSERSRLSVLIQSLCKTKMCYSLPSSVFLPKPKVDAAVIQVIPKLIADSPFHNSEVTFQKFQDLLSFGFRSPRKTIWNNLRELEGSAAALELAGIHPSVRPQDISTDQWIILTKILLPSRELKI